MQNYGFFFYSGESSNIKEKLDRFRAKWAWTETLYTISILAEFFRPKKQNFENYYSALNAWVNY